MLKGTSAVLLPLPCYQRSPLRTELPPPLECSEVKEKKRFWSPLLRPPRASLSGMRNHLEQAGEADRGGHLSAGLAPNEGRQGALCPRSARVFHSVACAVAAPSTWRAAVVFTNLPEIASCLGAAAARAAEQHLFATAGANVITALEGSRCPPPSPRHTPSRVTWLHV